MRHTVPSLLLFALITGTIWVVVASVRFAQVAVRRLPRHRRRARGRKSATPGPASPELPAPEPDDEPGGEGTSGLPGRLGADYYGFICEHAAPEVAGDFGEEAQDYLAAWREQGAPSHWKRRPQAAGPLADVAACYDLEDLARGPRLDYHCN